MLNNVILSGTQITYDILEQLHEEAKSYMSATNCKIRPSATMPTVVFYTFEKALAEAKAEGIKMSEEELWFRYNQVEAAYNPIDHIIYLKENQPVTTCLLIHELVHSLQPVEMLLEAIKDNSDQLRLDTLFEAEAYSLQAMHEGNMLEYFLNKSIEKGYDDPHEYLMYSWHNRGKNHIMDIINNK